MWKEIYWNKSAVSTAVLVSSFENIENSILRAIEKWIHWSLMLREMFVDLHRCGINTDFYLLFGRVVWLINGRNPYLSRLIEEEFLLKMNECKLWRGKSLSRVRVKFVLMLHWSVKTGIVEL